MPNALSFQELVTEYQDYVYFLANKVQRRYGIPKNHIEEMIAAGNLGLVEAAGRYDESLHPNFRQYAFLRIRGSILDCVRQISGLSVSAYRTLKKFKAYQDLLEEEASIGSDNKRIKSQKEELSEVLDKLSKGALIFKLDYEESTLPAEDENNAYNQVSKKSEIKLIKKFINKLSEKQKLVIVEYYFNDKSFTEIAAENDGLSKSWVSRLHVSAIDKIRELYMEQENA